MAPLRVTPLRAVPFNAARPDDAPLAAMPIEQFMRQYWQREPLLIRAALPDFVAPIDRKELAKLAANEDVESRLLRRHGDQWTLQHGPFARLPSRQQSDWTVLVQGVDLHLHAAHELLRRFRFVGDARLDDLMISLAGDGGGVGPHYDSYDVFLLQASGQRRWRIGATGYPDKLPALVDNLPLKIIKSPKFTATYDLVAGDILYLPPGWAHDGVAIGGECITYSIGFRSPSRLELVQAWLVDWAEQAHGADARYVDAGAAATLTPGALPEPMALQMTQWLAQLRPSSQQLARFIGCYLTEPKANVWFARPAIEPSFQRWCEKALRDGLTLDRKTRALYRSRQVYINGERSKLPCTATARLLVNARTLSSVKVQAAFRNDLFAREMHRWWTLGWLRFHNVQSHPC